MNRPSTGKSTSAAGARMGGMGVRSKPMDESTCVQGSTMGALRPPMPPDKRPMAPMPPDAGPTDKEQPC